MNLILNLITWGIFYVAIIKLDYMESIDSLTGM
jgi:hypothetical protein